MPVIFVRPLALSAALAAAFPLSALAQGVATDAQLEPVVLTARAAIAQLPADTPGNLHSVTAEQLRLKNLINPEDALATLPGLTIRKRYAGDRNAMMSGRSFGSLQPSRGLAYVDGLLISNFLGRFDAPRWNMVSPEAIARVDLMQGPFSALLPGNSIGATAFITEREVRDFEASARLTRHQQTFSLYGQTDSLPGHQASAFLANRWRGSDSRSLWASLSLNQQSSDSQPMQYFNVLKGKQWAAATPQATTVQGVQYDLDPQGQERAVLGAGSGAYDHSEQATARLKFGLDWGPRWQASGLLAQWTLDSDTHNRSFLKDAQGQTIWAGAVRDADHPERGFVIPNTAFAPSFRQERHQQWGGALKYKQPTGWSASLVASGYRIAQDEAHQALLPDPRALSEGGAGTVTRRDGTGWRTLEGQALWRGTAHRVALGWHHNQYQLDSPTFNTSNWRQDGDQLAQAYRGQTEVQALYAQDQWTLADDWTLTLGWRSERFRSFGGEQLLRTANCRADALTRCEPQADGSLLRRLAYAERHLSGESPKATLAWAPHEAWVFKASLGRGVRFPNVEELFNATFTATSQTLSDPNLRAERGDVLELSAEWEPSERHKLRVSWVWDDVRDAILRQSDTTVTPSVTRVSNVDRVRTQALEMVWQVSDLGASLGWPQWRGLALDANLTLADARVRANARDPAQVGKVWPRVPRWRANVQLVQNLGAEHLVSLGWRGSGRSFSTPTNIDVLPDVYGGVSRFSLLDVRTLWRPRTGWEWALGVTNALNQKAFQAHPYPGRTWLLEVRVQS